MIASTAVTAGPTTAATRTVRWTPTVAWGAFATSTSTVHRRKRFENINFKITFAEVMDSHDG
jgi:hypothetical protein